MKLACPSNEFKFAEWMDHCKHFNVAPPSTQVWPCHCVRVLKYITALDESPAQLLVSRGQTTIFSFVGAGKNRVWHISDTKLVLSHLEVLTLNSLFLSRTRYFIGNKAPVICFYKYGNEVFFFVCRKSSFPSH